MNQPPITYSDFTGGATNISSDPSVIVGAAIISIIVTLFVFGFFILITVTIAIRVHRRRRSTQRNRSEPYLDSVVTVCNADTDQMQDNYKELEPGIMHSVPELNNRTEITQHLAPVSMSNGNPTYSALEPDVMGPQLISPYLGLGSHNSSTLPAVGSKDVPQRHSTCPKLYHCPERLSGNVLIHALPVNSYRTALALESRNISEALTAMARPRSDAYSIKYPRAHPQGSPKQPHFSMSNSELPLFRKPIKHSAQPVDHELDLQLGVPMIVNGSQVSDSTKLNAICDQQVLDNQLHCHSHYHQWERVGAGIDCDRQCSSLPGKAQREARRTCTVASDSGFISAIDTPQSAYNSSLLLQRQRMSQCSISSMDDNAVRVIRGVDFVDSESSVWFIEAEKNAQVPFLCHQVLECGHKGMEHTIEEHDITLRVPEGAVPKGEKAHIEIGVAMYGPFSFPVNTRPISPILWLCFLEENTALKKDFQIVLPHFLTGLSTERLHYHQVGFSKAGHNQAKISHNIIAYDFNVCMTDILFASSGGNSYGVFHSDHCCFYCLQANQSPDLARDAGYCLTRIESIISLEIIFVSSFFLKSCLKAIKEQFPDGGGYRLSRCVEFKFKMDASTVEPCIKILPQKLDQFDIAFDPSRAEIRESEIDFWKENLDIEMMSLKHSMKMYPPRIKVTVVAKTACASAVKVLPVKITGCSREGQLDMDLIIGLRSTRLSLSTPSMASSGTMSENHSKDVNTQGKKPELRNVLKELLPLAAHWKTIGGLLGIDKAILDRIQRDEVGVNDRLHEMLAKWLKQVDPLPTWKDILDIIADFDKQRAQRLRRQIEIESGISTVESLC